MIFNNVLVLFFSLQQFELLSSSKKWVGCHCPFQGLQSKTHGPSQGMYGPFQGMHCHFMAPVIYFVFSHFPPFTTCTQEVFSFSFFLPSLRWSGVGKGFFCAALPLPLALGLAPLGCAGISGLPPSELSVPSLLLLLLLLLLELDLLSFVPAKSWL
jgi:hypothetical protein